MIISPALASRVVLALVLGTALGSHSAFANLQVFPTRVNLSDNKKVAHLSLRHNGTSPGRYNITAVFYRMGPEGKLEMVENARDDERSAVKLIRFSPKKATIPPNKEQVVRVIFAGPKNLPEGEYRAHIHFEPTDVPPSTQTSTVTKPGQISMAMQAKIAVAIPLVYKHGNPTFKATLSNLGLLRLPDQTPAFQVNLTSEGSAFAYGDFFAYFTPNGSKESKEVGLVRAVASYNKERLVRYPLRIPDDVKIANGTFRLEFRAPPDQGGNVLAAIEAPVQ